MTRVGVLDGPRDLGEALGRFDVDVPQHGEIGVRIDRPVLRRQIADVAVGRIDLVILAKIFVDGLGLRRRFDDDDIHSR